MEPSNIDLDDIFSVLPPSNVTVTSYQFEDKSRSGTHHSAAPSHVSHHTSKSSVSKVSSVQPESIDIPPEPKTRASTVKSSAQASSVSTIKESTHYVPAPKHLAVVHPEVSASSDDLMASIFGAVTLPDVHYDKAPSEPHYHAHHDILQHLDDALAGEDEHYQDSVATSHHSSHAASRATGRSAGSAPYHVADSVVRHSFDELELNGNGHDHHYAAEPTMPAPDYDYYESEDKFEPAHLPSAAPRGTAHRPRTFTVDSMASIAETRYGGIDIHDDYNEYTRQEIDLHNTEVAFNRPKPVKQVPASKVPVNSRPAAPVMTDDKFKQHQLTKLREEVVDARQRQAQLAAQVEREKAELEQLKLQKQSPARIGRGASIGSRTESSITVQSRASRYSENSYVSGSTVTSSRPSKDSIYAEEPVKTSEIANHHFNHGTVVGQVGKISLIVPETEEVQGFSKNPHVRKVVIGGASEPHEEDKTVLLFGPVGSGKTSAVNSMINYLYDVKKVNDFRFVLEAETHKTNALTAYVINNSILPFSITIVDTPGVIDEKNNRTVSTLIKTWFEQELLDAGAFRLDAISIVLKHDEDSLNWPFIYELAAVKKMFGDDLKTNVLPIITNSEVLPQPIAVKSLALANIAFVEYYKVNNIGFQPEAKNITKLQHNLFFSHGIAQLELFFKDLQEQIHPLLAILRGGAAKRSQASHHYDGSSLY